MTIPHYTYNGFYQDPKQPHGFRLLRINKDAGVMLYGKDLKDSKVWCVRGIITNDGIIKLNNTEENPSMSELDARLEDGRIVWVKANTPEPVATWQKKALHHNPHANTVIEKPMPKRFSLAHQFKIMLHQKIKHHLLQQPVVMQHLPNTTHVASVPPMVPMGDSMLLLLSLVSAQFRGFFY